ncbi:MAG: hypothetical protein Q9169_005155 [Polycauliona sp. 2 TL-2023]
MTCYQTYLALTPYPYNRQRPRPKKGILNRTIPPTDVTTIIPSRLNLLKYPPSTHFIKATTLLQINQNHTQSQTMSTHNQPASFFSENSSPRSSIHQPPINPLTTNPTQQPHSHHSPSPHPSTTSQTQKRVPFMNDPTANHNNHNPQNLTSLPASGGSGSDEPINPHPHHPYTPTPHSSASHHLSASLTSHDPSIPPIDTSSPEDHRISFRSTSLQRTLPFLTARFPLIEPLYYTKIFRGTITAIGLIWLDIGRQDTSPLDFSDLAHLLYCFEVYGQIICMLHGAAEIEGQEEGGRGGGGSNVEGEVELQRAVSDYKVRLLRMSQWATWASLLEWHKGFVQGVMERGQDRCEVWREGREDLEGVLRRRV